MKKIIILLIALLFILNTSFVFASSYQDLTTAQKNKYWDCMKDTSEGNSCIDLLKAKNYGVYRDCSIACFDLAENYNPGITDCTDTDGINYKQKGTVTSPLYPEGIEDSCYTFNPNTAKEKTYLFERACVNNKQVRYQKDCKEYGANYACNSGKCIMHNFAPVIKNTIGDKEISENQEVNFQLSASDLENDQITFEINELPDDATFDSVTGEFTFKPDFDFITHPNYQKQVDVKFRAFDGLTNSIWIKAKITVTNVNHKPVLQSIGDKEVDEQQEISFQVKASDSDNDLVGYHMYWCPDFTPPNNYGDCPFAVIPSGVSWNKETGLFEWTPTNIQAGTYGFKFYAYDAYLETDEEKIVITVNEVADSISGCTDPNANNYNSNANVDDNSCTYDISGCTDQDANNYNPNANIDDESCTYDIYGCTDQDANNYNSNANVDDGTCTYDILGCTDQDANNYNPNANIDDNSCKYNLEVQGCTDEQANNYNPDATLDDGSCNYAGELTQHFLNIEGKNRMYLVYEPHICKTQSCSLLIMFHGHGGTANNAANNYDWKNTADQNEFVAVFPESLDNLPGKDIKFGDWVIMEDYDLVGKKWDIAHVSLPLDQRYWTQDVEFTEQIIDTVNSEFDIEENKIFTTGHSYGAIFSYYIAACLPDKIAAFASHSGGLYTFMGSINWPIPARNVNEYNTPGMVIYSPGDNTIPPDTSIAMYDELIAKGQTAQIIQLPNSIGHKWDKSKNQVQWDFFIDQV
ncbi:hypothetical protein HOK51_01080 [Candidatus Woesearchaeota archaeon]|jgi:poly(3-hydroxybutyrate) depolymerase|nr:hypothetical protein [Candidatus Woesearchaeota archaeon]MBT6518408.1 hypothetical protein [Candidatus Woesearchaeota archaeon]MBT7366590.1 hypothetical protein [Candidatus Woesearchaeota archaeon]